MADSELRSGRVVVLGSAGFIGRSLLSHLGACRVETLGLSSREIDLCQPSAGARLAELLREDDRVVVAAGIPPGKPERAELVERNARLAGTLHAALVERRPAHVVYVSSDAVYEDSTAPICETTCAGTTRAYGMSHLVREAILRDACADRLAVVRSTMIYGAADPHAAYGPNRMLRTALRQGTIELFGHGEDVRDYLAIDDLCRLLLRVLDRASVGLANAASGEAVSARDVAGCIAAVAGRDVRIERVPRTQPASERRFDVGLLRARFPEWKPVPLQRGLEAWVRAARHGFTAPSRRA